MGKMGLLWWLLALCVPLPLLVCLCGAKKGALNAVLRFGVRCWCGFACSVAFRGFLGERGRGCTHPYFFSDRVDGGVTHPKTAQKIKYKFNGWGDYLILYIMPIALLRLPKNGKRR